MQGGLELDLATWKAWEQGLPGDLDERERYTATLLDTLANLLATAPFEWGLTGGTALQSYLPVELRRYSTDLEIITTADGETVTAWMEQQGHEPKRMAPGIHLCSLTPDGILFVIHDYPPRDFDAADIEARPFQHFPIEDHPPPDTLDVPLLSFEFLLATKLYAIQERDRGGERKKDAYDLALALTRASIDDVMEKLEVYAVHRGRPSEHAAIARSAGAWLDHFATIGYNSLSRWLPNYVPDGNPGEIRAGLEDALEALEAGLGEPIEPSDEERCRFLFQELSPAELTSVAERLGFEGDPVKESEKLRDTVLRGLVGERAGQLPKDVEQLREALGELGR